MSIPPFPSQDLAKLVLGYLAEEQLMTAYDEFLQASPYLDALQNEYDRIFMTSLKSILAEYRAVKIYVETCKPISLRRKVIQCTNLLDIVKVLVNFVDFNKLQAQESADKANVEKHQIGPNTRISCDTCALSKLTSCVCSKLRKLSNQSGHEPTVQNSIETTPLTDLPGNHVPVRKKQVKVLDKDSMIFSDGQSSSCSEKEFSNVCTEENKSNSVQVNNDVTVGHNSSVKTIDLVDSRKKIEEFDNVLQLVLDKKSTVSGSEILPKHRISNASTFQDFTSGVSGGENSNVPDSSTSDSMSTQASVTKEYFKDNTITQNRQLLLQVNHENMEIQTYRRDKDKTVKYCKIKAKTDDQKVKIISDVKVANKKKILKNATSTPVTTTPLVQMRTIVINGNPAYSHAPVITKHTYTKDEIMAMPTLIVVPASGAPKIPTNPNCKTITTQSHNTVDTAIPTAQPLGPLVIDVPPTSDIVNKPEVITKIPEFSRPDNIEPGLVKTIDLAKNASVPKDSISGLTKTPQVLPPVRKSSSTPRRTTTHVRVLDFTTPRRILQETNIEQVPSQTSDAPVEIVLSSSPNISFVDNTLVQNGTVSANTTAIYNNGIDALRTDGCDTDTGSAKENNTTSNINLPNKLNWDADLRASVAHDSALPSKITKRRSNSKKKKAHSKTDKRASCSNHISPKIKQASKKHRKVSEEEESNISGATAGRAVPPEVTVKPTINIISGIDRVATDIPPAIQECSKDTQTKDKEDELSETPDGDRLSLQNVIGARLNISDLLETPYKQALYDIQMGTPRFLPDLPGEPLSDIKITNIPTPRFLDTPKPIQATPSSWSSRPTDYSSGGSYYKPDDQDYMPIPDLGCVVSSSSKEDITSDKSTDIPKEDEKKSRPQRQCTKNVSYYRLVNPVSKPKEADDNIDSGSTCSESTCPENKNKESLVKTPRDRSRSTKSDTKKRVASRKKKSPAVKEKPKPFVKIKPRQTPTKITPIRNRKKTDTPGYPSPNKISRNRTYSKNMNTTSLVVAAPTKSRRKSSTPRKLHCTKTFNSEHSTHTSPEELNIQKKGQNVGRDIFPQDSDTEQIALRWSDDGSQENKINPVPSSSHDCEDISQIQEYIQSTSTNRPPEGSFQVDLMKRGFDKVTAEKIKRDLLDTPPPSYMKTRPPQPIETVQSEKDQPPLERTIETDSSATTDLQIVQDDEEEDEVELSVHECNEESQNYFVFQHDDTKEKSQGQSIQLKDTFSMNICIDDGVTVRLRATAFSLPLDQDPISVEEIDYRYDDKETEMAVNSISNIDRLYTPLKDSFKAQCYEIFDSTLTSIDTPLKATSPLKTDCSTTVTDIVLEDEQTQKDKTESKKRKRSSGSVESTSESKKTKYLLTSASIQDIDIESVLTKLHGP